MNKEKAYEIVSSAYQQALENKFGKTEEEFYANLQEFFKRDGAEPQSIYEVIPATISLCSEVLLATLIETISEVIPEADD